MSVRIGELHYAETGCLKKVTSLSTQKSTSAFVLYLLKEKRITGREPTLIPNASITCEPFKLPDVHALPAEQATPLISSFISNISASSVGGNITFNTVYSNRPFASPLN